MPLYRQTQPGQFVPFEKIKYPDLERDFESWIESNPYLLLEDEPLAIIGRQVSNRFGKVADLLAVDESGACVVIELKRGMAPREVIAQTLEYTAWVDSLTLEELHAIARNYSLSKGTEVEGVWDLYRGTFEHQSEDLEESDVERRITLNFRQRMVIVAEAFPPEMEQTLRYIRSKHGVDINAVRFGLHRAGDDILLEAAVVVGRESVASITVKTEKLSARSQGPQGTDPRVQAKVTALFKEGKRNDEIAAALKMHPFQVSLARALTGQMKPGPMVDYFKDWAKKHS